MKKNIQRAIHKIFYTLFPELAGLQTVDVRSLREKLRSVQSQLKPLSDTAKIRFVMEYLDRSDPEFLKEYDRWKLPAFFKERLGYELNFDAPETFNEKLQWLKIHCRKPEMAIMADKYRVRDYLNEKGYGRYANTVYGVYHSLQDIREHWDALPLQFVLKPNHWSSAVSIVRDKNAFDEKSVKPLVDLLKKNYYYDSASCAEWPYKNIVPCIIAEKYLEDEQGGLLDYKVFCFNGRAHFIQVDVDRHTHHTRCFYDTAWQKQDFTTLYPLYGGAVDKPCLLADMLAIAESLSADFAHMRVDFYHPGPTELILGELTFFHGGGVEPFLPREWDLKMGALLDLKNSRV